MTGSSRLILLSLEAIRSFDQQPEVGHNFLSPLVRGNAAVIRIERSLCRSENLCDDGIWFRRTPKNVERPQLGAHFIIHRIQQREFRPSAQDNTVTASRRLVLRENILL